MERPNFVTENHLTYLDKLHASGKTNMYGASAWLEAQFFNLTKQEARAILEYWMHTFSERHPQD